MISPRGLTRKTPVLLPTTPRRCTSRVSYFITTTAHIERARRDRIANARSAYPTSNQHTIGVIVTRLAGASEGCQAVRRLARAEPEPGPGRRDAAV